MILIHHANTAEGLKELPPISKDQVGLLNAAVWIPDSKTPNGIGDVPLTLLAIKALRSRMSTRGGGAFSVSERPGCAPTCSSRTRSGLRNSSASYRSPVPGLRSVIRAVAGARRTC